MGKLRKQIERAVPRARAPVRTPPPGMTLQAPRYVPPAEARPRTARASISVENRGRTPAVVRNRTARSRQELLYNAAAQTTAALASELEELFGSLSDLEDEPMPPAQTGTRPEAAAATPTSQPPLGTPAAPGLPTPPPTPATTPTPGAEKAPSGPPPGYGYFTGSQPTTNQGRLDGIPWDRIRPGQRYRHRTAGRTVIVKRLRNGEFRVRE
ncbi:PREDICTED: proline-rich protein 36-like [Vollenhovia emeryi]|uniref:proline-rich protein 36-like n=1 Tax=Vollenhovia emeryi TaxID=411798 RepID=UPI0005F50EE1|nr:PREDICTED: proline-rich protein 36-like [Vollenhovia emeryi]